MFRKEKGFTLIELLIVIAIIGILAAIAIPMYRTQTIKAKMTEVTNAMSNVASALSAYRQENGAWPSEVVTGKDRVHNSFGVATSALSRLQNISVSTSGVITGTVTNIDSTVDNKTLLLTPTVNTDGSISWDWSGGTGGSKMPSAYVPSR